MPVNRGVPPIARAVYATVLAVMFALAGAVVPSLATAANDGGASPGPTPCPGLNAGTKRLPVDPSRVPVLLHIPRGGVPAGTRLPVVIVLGGANQTGRAVAALTGYSRLADQRRFLVAYPTARGPRPSWIFAPKAGQDDSDVAYLRSVVAYLTGPAVCADPTRVGLTGISNGAGMTARMACSAADLLAAAAPVSGGYSTLPPCQPARPVPILEIHGANDPTVPYAGKGPDFAGSVDKYLAGWLGRDGCTTPPRVRAAYGGITQTRWTCSGGTIVQGDKVDGLGHDWAGRASLKPFSATVATWQFLSAFRNPGPAAG